MYVINTIPTATLITLDEVLSVIATDEHLDNRIILNTIFTTEQELIVPLLGKPFYNAMVAQKNIVITSGNQSSYISIFNNQPNPPKNAKIPIDSSDLPVGSILNAVELMTNNDYATLWKNFLLFAVAEAVDLRATSHSRVRHTASGQEVKSPNNLGGSGGAADAGLRSTDWKMDLANNQRVNPLFVRVSEYICDNYTLFPLYDTCRCNNNAIPNTGGIVLGVNKDKFDLIAQHNARTHDKLMWWDDPISKANNSYKPTNLPTPSVKTVKTLYFTCIDGQTMYPYVGQPNEAAILQSLNGALFITLSLNGVLLTQGSADGDVIGFVGNPQRIEWVTPAVAGTTGILIFNN